MAAIADYNTLSAEVKAWCARSDSVFSARMPVLVELAEERLYNGHDLGAETSPLWSPPLRTRAMEATASVTVTSGAGTLPDDMLALRKVTRANDDTGLTYVDPTTYDKQVAAAGGVGGVPALYTVEAATIRLVPSWSGPLTLLYYQRLPAISPDNQTNALIAAHGLAYFQATMFEAFSFMQEPDLALGWLAKYRATVLGINATALATRMGGARARMSIRAIG